MNQKYRKVTIYTFWNGYEKDRWQVYWQGCGEIGTLKQCWWEYNIVQLLWKIVGQLLKMLTIELARDSSSTPKYTPQMIENSLKQVHECELKYHHCHHSSLNVRPSQGLISRWMDKQDVFCAYRGIVFSHKKGSASLHPCYSVTLQNTKMSERSQIHKTTCYMIQFIGNVQNRQISRNRKLISDWQGLGQWLLMVTLFLGYSVSFWCDIKCSKITFW